MKSIWFKTTAAISAGVELPGGIAAKSVGEPSTQITSSTFHLVNCSEINVSLDILDIAGLQ